MATKSFVNHTGFRLKVTLTTRAGATLLPNGVPPPPFTLAVNETKYITFAEEKLNAIKLSWQDAGAQCISEQEVTELGSWWDQTINNNNNIIFEEVNRDAIRGTVKHYAETNS